MEDNEDINDFLDELLSVEGSNSITSEMDAIKDDEQEKDYSEEINKEDKQNLFEISDEEIEAFDREINVEQYVIQKDTINIDEENQNNNNEEKINTENKDDKGNSFEELENDLYGNNDDEDEEVLDVNDPDLRSYQTSSDSVTLDELSEKKSDNDIEDEFSFREGKKSFEEVSGNGKKKAFEPGKLNKNNMILAICAFLGLLLLGFWWATRDNSKSEKSSSYEDDININDYNPDFGDYQNRAYKEEPLSEEEEKAYDTIDEILYSGNKEEFKEEPKVQYVSSSQTSAPQNTTPADDTYQKRVESSIRKGITPKDYGYGSNVSYGGGADPYGYGQYTGGNIPQANANGGYFDQLGQITSSLAQNRGAGQNGQSVANQSQALRYTDAGRYIRDKEGGDYTSIPPNSIYPGYIIPAVLVSGINTDYPGDITARVTSNIYDSRTGSVLLIPSGSILRGSYSSSSIGIKRIQIAWQSLIINRNGVDYFVNLGSMVGVDSKGYSGIAGTLNDHYFEYLKAAGLASLFTYINSNVYSVSKAQKNRVTAQMIDDSQEIGNKLADKLLDRALDIAPTVTVQGGTRINVDVNKILTLQPYERDMPKTKYRR